MIRTSQLHVRVGPRSLVSGRPRAIACLVSIVGLLAPACGWSNSTPKTESADRQWFAEISQPLKLNDEALGQLAAFAMSAVQGAESTEGLSDELKADRLPRIVLLDVSNGRDFPQNFIGSGHGIVSAITNAAAVARRTVQPDEFSAIRIDIVQMSELCEKLDEIPVPPSDLGIFGLAFPQVSGRVIAPDELMLSGLVDKSVFTLGNVLQRLREEADDDELGLATDEPAKLYRFTTQAVYFDGQAAVPLVRGHRTFAKINDDELLMAAVAAGNYLIRSVEADGRFIYQYDPVSGEVSDDYNFVRHAGTTYSMFELYDQTQDAKLLAAADRALEFLLANLKPGMNREGDVSESSLGLVDEESEVKLGGNALLALAIAKRAEATGRNEHASVLEKLCTWIIDSQAADGRFAIHKQFYPEGDIADFESEYFPGEAIFALVRSYDLLKREEYLDAAERAARYLITVRDAGLARQELQHDHWLLYGLNELQRHRPDKIYLNHAMEIAAGIVESQIDEAEHVDWIGAFTDRPEANPTATRTEGLSAAWLLARDFDRAEDAERIHLSIEKALRFQLQLQYRPESVLYLAEPHHALGGFRDTLSRHVIRIDTVQHNLSAVLGAYRIRKRLSGEPQATPSG